MVVAKFSYEANPWTSPHANTNAWPRTAGGAWPCTTTLLMHAACPSELEHNDANGSLPPLPIDHHQELLTRVFFEVPLDDKERKEPVKTDFFEETFLTICQLKRIDGMWRLGTGDGRKRDDDETPAENVENVEVNEGEEVQQDFDWEQVEEDAEIHEEEQVEEEVEVQGEPRKKRVIVEYSRSWSRPLRTSSRL
ncbi:hypothetical protein Dimus_017638 [Dionaea muscipula]